MNFFIISYFVTILLYTVIYDLQLIGYAIKNLFENTLKRGIDISPCKPGHFDYFKKTQHSGKFILLHSVAMYNHKLFHLLF